MRTLLCCSFLVSATLALVGCSAEPPGPPRFETSPVTGIVHVDGSPAELVEVECHPASDSSAIKYTISTTTNSEGVFTLTTYEASDGLPEGTYTLCFKWLEPALVPKDKFKGAYADPKKSKQTITVVKGQETKIGTIELLSTGPK